MLQKLSSTICAYSFSIFGRKFVPWLGFSDSRTFSDYTASEVTTLCVLLLLLLLLLLLRRSESTDTLYCSDCVTHIAMFAQSLMPQVTPY